MTGYLSSSSTSGYWIGRLGVGKVLALSCAISGAGLIGYTLVPQWWMMVLLGVAAGLGAGAIDAGLNTYVAANFGEGLMQWLHASYGVGVTTGPIIMTYAINALHSWRAGYDTVGSLQLLLAAAFVLTLPMWARGAARPEAEPAKKLTDYKTPYSETLRRPRVWLSMLLFYVYVGAEVSLGTWAYTLLTEGRGVASQTAGLWAGSYWAMFTVGRILAGPLVRRVGVQKLVLGGILAALGGAALLWWNPTNTVGLIGVALIGFAIAPIFPGMTSGTRQRVGDRFTANTIGMQMAASSLGAASVPSLVGVLARGISLEVVPVCLFALFSVLLLLYQISQRPTSQPAE
jgi:fucose permease